jgi:hypothetical protein
MPHTLAIVQQLAAAGNVPISQHAHDRFTENGITTAEVVSGVATAVLVEDYPDFHKGPSFLALQQDAHGNAMHVVWGIREGTTEPAVVITVYRPDPQLWSADFRRHL